MRKVAWDVEKIRRLVFRSLAEGRYAGHWEIAVRARISPSTLSRVLSGERGMSVQLGGRLAEALGVDVEELLCHRDTSFLSAAQDTQKQGNEINSRDPREGGSRGSAFGEEGDRDGS